MEHDKILSLTYSQCKAFIKAGIDIKDVVQAFENQPDFIKRMEPIIDFEEVALISQQGCSSGAYMPAVTYHTARQCFSVYVDAMLEYLHERGCERESVGDLFNLAVHGFSKVETNLCSVCVEEWCLSLGEYVDILENAGVLYV